MRFAKLLRDARSSAGLSQTTLASRAKTSQPAIARYESGVATPSLATLDRILRACGRSVIVGTTPAPRVSRPTSRGSASRVRRYRRELLEAASRHGVSDVRIFGSVARGDARPESDVDLLVDLEPGRTLLDLIGFKQDAEDILGVSVDAAAPRFMKDRVRRRALKEARAL